MNKNNFIWKFLAVSVGSLLFVVCIIYLFAWSNNNKMQGKLVFSETYNKGLLIDKIELVSSEDTVVISHKNNYWVLENKNDYYADFRLVSSLLNSINKSIYSIKFPFNQETADKKLLNNPAKDEKNSGILIRTFIKNEKVDEIIVGLADESENYYFSRNLKDDNIWLISENFNFPVYSRDWIIRPIISLPAKQIEIVQIDDKQVNRLSEHTLFYDEKGMVTNIDVLTDVLSGLFVVNAVKNEQFETIKSDDMKFKNIKFTTFFGLVLDLDLYSNDKKVWCKIKLSTTTLPMTVVNDYINDNKFLYEDWYFEVSPSQGHILRDFHFI